VQARIKEMQPRAIYVHCASQNLNLVLNDCITSIPQLCNFTVYLRECTRSLATVLKDGSCSLEKEQLAPHLKGYVLQGGLAETTRLMQ
jgi:hypothetical protein